MPPPIRAAGQFAITYRPMVEAQDLPFVAELYASTRREEVAQTGWPPEMQEAFLRQQHEAQHSHYSLHFAEAEWLIVERGGEAIGRLYLRDDPDTLSHRGKLARSDALSACGTRVQCGGNDRQRQSPSHNRVHHSANSSILASNSLAIVG